MSMAGTPIPTQTSMVYTAASPRSAVLPLTGSGRGPVPPEAPPPPSSYLDLSQPTALSVSQLQLTMPPTTTYFHVPPTFTVTADVHAPYTLPPATTITAPTPAYTSVPHSTSLFTAPIGTVTLDTVVPPPTACTPSMTVPLAASPTLSPPVTTAATAAAAASLSLPTLVVKQPQLPKPYNAQSSWKSFRDHFDRVCRVNDWTTLTDKVQHLSLALEGPAAEVLKNVDETSTTAYDDIWALLARRFGQTDAPRDAMRRFDVRRQMDGESIPEFEAALRVLYREEWPHASAVQRDSTLKRRFEEGVLNLKLREYLRLHAPDDDFAASVLRARYFVETREITRPKKCVRIITPPPDHTSDTVVADDDSSFIQRLLKGIKDMMTEHFSSASVKTVNRDPSPGPASQPTRDGDRDRPDSRSNGRNRNNRDRSQSTGNNRPPRDGNSDSRSANPRPQSPAPYGRQSSGFDNRRQFRSPSPGPYRNQPQSRPQSSYRSQSPYRPQSPAPRWNQRPQTPPPPPPPPRYDRRS